MKCPDSFLAVLKLYDFTCIHTPFTPQLEEGITSEAQPLSSGTSYTASDLTPATNYVFRVVVINSVGMVMSEDITAKTLDDIPSAVQSLASSTMATSVSLSWGVPATPNGDIIGYAVRVGEGESVEVRGCGGWGDSVETNYDVMGLTPSTEYLFEVSACTNAGMLICL